MELSTLQELLPNPERLISAIKDEKVDTLLVDNIKRDCHEVGLNQYDPSKHAIKDRAKRPDLIMHVPNGQKDEMGNAVMVSQIVPVARMAIPIQRYIIKQRASFVVGNKIELKPSIPESKVYDAVRGQWKKNKIHFQLKEVARRLMAETEVAVIFYSDPAEKVTDLRLRLKIISPSTGDKLYPVFDSMDDMIAFGRSYTVGKVERFDLYTAESILRFETTGGKLEAKEVIKLPYNGKMPVIYWHQPEPECNDVQDLIEARERIQSDFFDTNLRIGDPIMVATTPPNSGDSEAVIDWPAAGRPGKIIQATNGADVKFISPTDATKARELEFQMLDDLIYSLTRTVKLDPESLKGLGIESGAAMDRLLIAPHMAAKDMQDGEFGEGVQRMLNFMTHVYAYVLSVKDDLDIEPVFSLFRIDDATERVTLARLANGEKPIMSHKESIQMAGFTEDADATLSAIQADEETTQNEPGRAVPLGVAV